MNTDIKELIFIRKSLLEQRGISHELLKKYELVKATGVNPGFSIPEEEEKVRKNIVRINRALTACDRLIKKPHNPKLALELKALLDV